MKAAGLFEEGRHSNSEIAHRLGVSQQSVSKWYQLWQKGGSSALSMGKPGCKRRLNDAQIKDIEQALLQGPRAYGYDTEFWSLQRIADLIRERTGIDYCASSVWYILKSIGWSYQKPQRRAKQRDEEAILRWKDEHWPRIKKGRKMQAQE